MLCVTTESASILSYFIRKMADRLWKINSKTTTDSREDAFSIIIFITSSSLGSHVIYPTYPDNLQLFPPLTLTRQTYSGYLYIK